MMTTYASVRSDSLAISANSPLVDPDHLMVE